MADPWTSTASTSSAGSDPVHWSCGCPWPIHGHPLHQHLAQGPIQSTGRVYVLGRSMDILCINIYPRVRSSPLVVWMFLADPWTSSASTSSAGSDPVYWSCGCPWPIHGHPLHQHIAQGPIQSTVRVDVLGRSMDIHCINIYPVYWSCGCPTASTSSAGSDPVHWSCVCPWPIHGHPLHQHLSQGPIQSTGRVDVLGRSMDILCINI